MRAKKKSVGAAVLCAALLLSACSSGLTARSEIPGGISVPVFIAEKGAAAALPSLSEEDEQALSEFEQTAESDYLALYLNRAAAAVAVLDKRSAKVWYSNSPQAGQDTTATEESRPALYSQFTLEYIENSQFKTVDSYTGSVSKGLFQIQEDENSVEIVYTVRAGATTVQDVPQALRNERYVTFFVSNPALSVGDISRMKTFYQKGDDGVWRLAKEDDESLAAVANILVKAGYTAEELTADQQEFGLSSGQRREFVIPVRYALEGDSLLVTVETERMAYPSAQPLVGLTLLEHFGNEEPQENGYMLVPDGGGALISLLSSKNPAKVYQGAVYGGEKTLASDFRGTVSQPVVFPVFGMKAADGAFFAVVESGEALATIHARRAGNVSDLNGVYASFSLSAYQDVSIGSSVSTQIKTFQNRLPAESLRLRYAFLNREKAGYAGMADYYRQYLMATQGLSRTDGSSALPLLLETVGAIRKDKSFLGFQYEGLEALTTFGQTQEILQTLQNDGISRVFVRLTGWANKGLNSTAADRIKPVGALGSARDLTRLQDWAEQAGDTIYPDMALLTAAKDSSGYNQLTSSARKLDDTTVQTGAYDLVTQELKTDRYVLSPLKLPGMMEAFLRAMRKESWKALSLDGLAGGLYADYGSGRDCDRTETQRLYESLLQSAADQGNSLLLTTGNVYALSYAGCLTGLPLTASGFDICDEAIPFTAMVLHGLIPYAGEALNRSEKDSRAAALEALSVGALPSFQVMAADNSTVKSTDYGELCSNHFESWRGEIATVYAQYAAALGDVQDQFITGYERLEDGVTQTAFENGVILWVNATEKAVVVGGETLPPLSFRSGKGDGQ